MTLKISKKDKKNNLEKVLNDYKKSLKILKDKQSIIFIEAKIKEQI
jgi:hypothetical protein